GAEEACARYQAGGACTNCCDADPMSPCTPACSQAVSSMCTSPSQNANCADQVNAAGCANECCGTTTTTSTVTTTTLPCSDQAYCLADQAGGACAACCNASACGGVCSNAASTGCTFGGPNNMCATAINDLGCTPACCP